MKRFTLQKTHSTLLFVPLVFVVISLAILGVILVRGYDQGSLLPLVSTTSILVEAPEIDPVTEPVEIADTSQLPETISTIPAPSKVQVTQRVSLKPQAKESPVPRAIPAPTPVLQNVINDISKPTELPSLPAAGHVAGASTTYEGLPLTPPVIAPQSTTSPQ